MFLITCTYPPMAVSRSAPRGTPFEPKAVLV